MAQARRLAEGRVDYLQVREKDLSGRELRVLLERIRVVLPKAGGMQILINAGGQYSTSEIQRLIGDGLVEGTHLPDVWTQDEVGSWRDSVGAARTGVVSVACHEVARVREAGQAGADLILFSPVFEKRAGGVIVAAGASLERLSEAVVAAGTSRVFALGGVTTANAQSCIKSGAAGVAGIRMFADL